MANLKIAILIDGGFLRVLAKKTRKHYDPDFIEKFAHACKAADEDIFRVYGASGKTNLAEARCYETRYQLQLNRMPS